MSLKALTLSAVSRLAGGRLSLRRGLSVSSVAVLALAASGCQLGTTGPLPPSTAYLQFTVQPPVYAAVDQPLTSSVKVSVVDAQGRTLTDASVAVTVTLGANLMNATLSGTTTVRTSGGVATFSDLSVDRLGTYMLVATAGDLPEAASEPIEVDLHPAAARTGVASGNGETGGLD